MLSYVVLNDIARCVSPFNYASPRMIQKLVQNITTMDTDASSDARKKAEAVLASPTLQFNIAGLPALTDFLNEQMADANTYSLDNNVAILKIYTLFPHIADPIVIQKILVQCLTQLPANDFNICIAQVPLPTQEHPVIAQVVSLHNMLQSCLFHMFWDAARKPMAETSSALFIEVPGLRESIRRFILDVVPLVYLQMSVPELLAMLDFENNCEEFEQLLQSCRWTLEGGYKRDDPNSGICVPAAREDVVKQIKPQDTESGIEKYFKTDSMRLYHSTLRHAAG
ncbi:Eukaryotic translation initiation factor 3 subunit K [Babesia sp. Xinjiang]|uniref:Eukaryotic translation initiation factor 3 subunit K n=1 Tax=Babesia sp. Xinjiang TaxID=462227 RepID=UPI000A24EE4B|nr:Eukaryotic translation initiation factor 3 subunit K [Babesia sp. Xinjiang]ORM40184.1 Eukaryotic translation initiation factor 3 subunit K [Babesia sp. Xinjiang]